MMPRPKPEEPQRRITIVVPESLARQVERIAGEQDLPVSVLLRHWMRREAKRVEEDAPDSS